MAQHTHLRQIHKVILGQLLEGGVAAQVGGVIHHAAHLHLGVSLRRQAGITVAVHIQGQDNIAPA